MTALERKPRHATNVVKPATARTNVPFVHAVHVAFERSQQLTNQPFVSRARMQFVGEGPKGHNNTVCPRAECQTCMLFGRVAKDCEHANCLDVEADWFNDWFNNLLASCESIVGAYFPQVSVPATSLRTDGFVRPISNWDQLQLRFALSANHLMEIKCATYSFKRDKNRKYKRLHDSRVSRQARRQEQRVRTQHQLHLQASVST